MAARKDERSAVPMPSVTSDSSTDTDEPGTTGHNPSLGGGGFGLAGLVWPAPGGKPGGKSKQAPPSTRRKTQNILNVACALDGADMQLLPSTFRALERELHLRPQHLSQLSLYQSLFQSLSAPVWGYLADRYSRQTVLSYGCILWGVITIVLAASTTLWEMVVLRALNGIALASVGPLSQSMIADLFGVEERGGAFGWVQLSQNVGAIVGGVATTSVSQMYILGVSGWRVGFMVVGLMSIGLGVFVSMSYLSLPRHAPTKGDDSPTASKSPSEGGQGVRAKVVRGMLREVRKIRLIARKPTFWGVVMQGIFGGIPWNAMAFFTMWFQYVGFADYQAAIVWAALQAGGGLGGLLGGYVGDSLARWNENLGRPLAAQLSVALGIPVTALILQIIPRSPDWYVAFLIGMFLLGLVAAWCPAATNRPILTDIVDPADRATIFAWLLAIEGAAAAVFGAPSVAILAEVFFGYKMSTLDVKTMSEETRIHNVNALANSLTLSMMLPWSICFFIYGSLHFTYRHDRLRANKEAYTPVIRTDDTAPSDKTFLTEESPLNPDRHSSTSSADEQSPRQKMLDRMESGSGDVGPVAAERDGDGHGHQRALFGGKSRERRSSPQDSKG
ncbi:unnamed protein product [Vitrella brassicaformis CCMP3155]|uniref:Major facilitator superfamily (MFS) profile domain-containing protein n=2 Tax=Vitrella brassicaformis TaxID=1169539 RepID=A0A0G4G9U1_VITBC|nr:unnamed protein product [Vitrella brassicaformis CCMP3155]|eukprot:CEM25714.1 unnamed protein product [Vitrella brassicaformis CCMP3155]